MAVYEYKALNPKGKQVAGIIDADTPADARSKLRRRNIFPIEVRESTEKVDLRSDEAVSRLLNRVKTSDVVVFTRQLATLIDAGLPLLQALNALIDQLEMVNLIRMLLNTRDTTTMDEPPYPQDDHKAAEIVIEAPPPCACDPVNHPLDIHFRPNLLGKDGYPITAAMLDPDFINDLGPNTITRNYGKSVHEFTSRLL